MTGWTLTGVLVAPVMSHAMNAEGGAALFLFIVGGTFAVIVGARVSARWRGRDPRADGLVAGGAYVASALVFLALIAGRPAGSPQDFPQFLLYALICLLLFGGLFGIGAAKYYKVPHPGMLVAGLAAAALLGGVLIFILGYLLAGGNILVVYGIVPMKWKVPVGLLLSGFLGSLLPGILAETLLPASFAGSSSSLDNRKEHL
jgi:hypothetical protein